MPLFLVSAKSITHTRIHAATAEQAAEIWRSWRERHNGELHASGAATLLDLASPVKIGDVGGKLVGEIHGGCDFSPARGS